MRAIILQWGNPMTSKMLDWKIQPNLTPVKTIKHDAVGRVLDCFLHKRGGLDFESNVFWAFGLTFQHGKKINSGKILVCDGLDNLSY